MDAEDIEAAFEEDTSDVAAWSSTHLSDDDSDDEEISASSRSPSHSVEEDEREASTHHDDAVEELSDNWMLDVDVDVPDATRPQNTPPAPMSVYVPTLAPRSEAKERKKEVAKATEIVPPPQQQQNEAKPHDIRPVEQVSDTNVLTTMTSLDDELARPKFVSQIPRLARPLNRKFSLNAEANGSVQSRGSPSPPRLQRSPSKTQSLSPELQRSSGESRLSPTGALRRGQSVYITPGTVSSRILKQSDATAPPPHALVSTSSQFWANEQNRRSSRLLDEWKRKEIWHDFKRAEENVLTNPPPSTSTASSSVAAALMVPEMPPAHTSIDKKTDSATSLNDLLHDARSDILRKQADQLRPPLRRATSFAVSGSPSPGEESASAAAKSSRFAGGDWPSRSSPASTTQTFVPVESVSKAEYERLLDDKRRLEVEAECRQRALLKEQEVTRGIQGRLAALENSDRENRFLKEEIQKHLMHELSSKELIRTLEDQLALTTRSEDQLKLQTRQLMQQNQTLQADLLEKMAAETSKIQKLAHLSAEKQKLQDDLQRNEAQSAQKVAQQRVQVRSTMLRHLLSVKRSDELKVAFRLWQAATRERAVARVAAATVLITAAERIQVKAVARAFRQLHHHALHVNLRERVSAAQEAIDAAQIQRAAVCRHAAAALMSSIMRSRDRVDTLRAWKAWQGHVQMRIALEHRLTMAAAKLWHVLVSRRSLRKQRAFSLWSLHVMFDAQRLDCERAKQSEAELVEAKDCVFALSRAKTRLEDKLQASRLEVQRGSDQLREHRAELQLVKHGYVTTVVRATERGWVRSMFDAWRVQTKVEACAKEFRLQLEMAELKVEERDKYARSLDDYNKVLRNDLERFQFFSQDKRVAVDVLTKKLLREEEKIKQMEESHVVLEEKMLAYKSQLSSLLEWQGGIPMPLALVHLCRDATAGSLRELFERLASASRGDKLQPLTSPEDSEPGDVSASCRLALHELEQFLSDSNMLSESQAASSDLHGLVRRNTPEYAATQGLLFHEFVVSMNAIAKEAFESSPKQLDRIKLFWSSLIDRVLGATRSAAAPTVHREVVDGGLHQARSPWAGQLSEDILQNQEKLLAVLEHETAVVERAVMEKSSLKHTYASSEHSVASTVKEFHEYQCDPVAPPDSQPPDPGSSTTEKSAIFPSADCQFMETGLSQFANWSQSGQVRDLFLAFHRPLQRIVVKYSNEKRVAAHGNQICLHLSGMSRMLEDMRLYPNYLSRDLVHHHFGRLCDRDGLLTPQALAMFLGCCALELFAKSLPNAASGFRLSAREIVLSFYCDLGLLPDSDIPSPPRICLVGVEVEAVLWPLFEYYAVADGDFTERDAAHERETQRASMTLEKFVKFSGDIINTAPVVAERLFERVAHETRRVPSLASPTACRVGPVVHLDEFYVALAYLQMERCPSVHYANLGEAVRHWMQQQ